ncbi:MAG: thioredoxin domain-containing protein, partial [Proteobacteria bacterium]|nr:thioredoxin domain-containing protein [Pseudomonadota bacterium]
MGNLLTNGIRIVLISSVTLVASACTWNMPDYWNNDAGTNADTGTGADTDTDSDSDMDTNTSTDMDTDTDTGSTDDAGTCSEDDTDNTCGDKDTDMETDTDTGTDFKWDGGTGEYDDFCGNPAYAIYLRYDGYSFNNENAPYRGNGESPEVEITGFSHFYCSHCRNAAELLADIFSNQAYSERVVYYFRHYLWEDDINMMNWDPHKAAHAAHMQGYFWDMHDAIFFAENIPDDDFLSFA